MPRLFCGFKVFSVAVTQWFDEALTANSDRGEEGITRGVSEFKAAWDCKRETKYKLKRLRPHQPGLYTSQISRMSHQEVRRLGQRS